MNSLKIAMYWHNGRSLGHTAGSARVAELILRDQDRTVSLAGVTGAYRGHDLLPDEMDLVKIPSFTNRDDADGWELVPRLDFEPQVFTDLRRDMITTFMQAFRPDFLLADHIPRGREDELVDAIERRTARTNVLTLRGVLFDREKTNRKYFTGERGQWVDQNYDLFMVHMPREVFDLAEHYDIPDSIQRRMRYTGYLTEPDRRPRRDVRRRLGVDPAAQLCVCAMGGGQGAGGIWDSVVPVLLANHDLGQVLIVTGPYLEPRTFQLVTEASAKDPRITVAAYSSDLRDWMRASDVFIGAAGANMVAELLAADANAVLVPRQTMEVEQAVHSIRLTELGLTRRLTIPEIEAGMTGEVLTSAIAHPIRPHAEHLLWAGGSYLDRFAEGG